MESVTLWRSKTVNPSDVRTRVLAEHIWLSEKLCRLEASAAAVKDGNLGEAGRLRERALDLCEALLLHLATEDEILVPLLRGLDAWGEVRVERVQGDHEAQRGEVAQLCFDAEHEAPPELAETVLAFTHALRADMEHEERVSLGRDLLRDDTVSVDQLDG
jgi:hypothetical protein